MATRAPSSSSTSSREKDQEIQGRGRKQFVMPEDGYEWKKYGQKYIVKIEKNRSYLKCKRENCEVKKTVEWLPTDSSNMRIMYEGVHNHQPPCVSSRANDNFDSTPNPYDLRNQFLGEASNIS